MKFEDALPMMRDGTYMTRAGDPLSRRIRVSEVDGTLCFVSRPAVEGRILPPAVANVSFHDVLAEDWRVSEILEEHRAKGGDAQEAGT